MRKLFAVALCFMVTGLTGCTTLPKQDPANPTIVQAKTFEPAPEGKGKVYVFRDSWYAKMHGKELSLDGKVLGQEYNKSFFMLTLDAGKSYKLATESEFTDNEITLPIEAGKTYFVEHYMRIGVGISPQADFNLLTSEEEIQKAKESIMTSRMNFPEEG